MSTFLLKRGNKCSELPVHFLEAGIRKVKSILLNITVENEHILEIRKTHLLLLISLSIFKRKGKSPTIVSIPKKRIMALNNKKIFLDNKTLVKTWLQTAVVGLGGKVLEPFWNSQCEENSELCWLGGNETKLTYSNWNPLCSRVSTYNPTPNNSWMASAPIEDEKREDIGTRCRKIRIYPDSQQKSILRQWIGTTRYVYNKALAELKKGELKYNFFSLRNRFVTAESNSELKEWELLTPKDVRAGALKDLVTAFKAAMTNLSRKNIFNFDLGYRKKGKEASISIAKSAIKIKAGKLIIYPTYKLGKIRLSNDRCLSSLNISCDCRLGMKNDIWYLYVPIKVETKNKGKDSVCALDPGVRKFQTIYSEEAVTKIHVHREAITRLQKKVDILNSLRARKLIRKNHYKRGQRRAYNKLSYLVDDLHYKTINFLSQHYGTVIIPIFESQDMVRKNKNRNCNRNMLQLKHFRFRQRLMDKYNLLENTKVTVCTEEYTSKTCTRCGSLNNNLGMSEIFICPECNLKIDRDVNGARNIYLKAFST